MVKYKKVKPEITEGFLDKLFGKLATSAASKAIKDIQKKDAELGKLIATAQDLRKRGEARLAKMTKQERDDEWADMVDKYM